MPYSHEINDKPVFEKLAPYRRRVPRDDLPAVRRALSRGRESGRVMAIALHPYLTGVPHRIDAFEAALAYICGHPRVWKATGSEICPALSRAGREAMRSRS